MRKLTGFVMLGAILAFMVIRINKLDRDIDNAYGRINQQTDVIKELHSEIVYMRAEIADIMVELTQKGLIDPAPSEAPSNRAKKSRL